jgi:hypothetical protein
VPAQAADSAATIQATTRLAPHPSSLSFRRVDRSAIIHPAGSGFCSRPNTDRFKAAMTVVHNRSQEE